MTQRLITTHNHTIRTLQVMQDLATNAAKRKEKKKAFSYNRTWRDISLHCYSSAPDLPDQINRLA